MLTPSDISVIVCTRNRPGYLREALAAIRKTTPAETEVVVVDSASDTDETRQIAEEAGVVYVLAGAGLSVARNAGIHASARPFVIFTDDDCLPEEGWIDVVLPHFEDPTVGAVTGRMLHRSESAAKAPYRRQRLYRTPVQGLDAGHGAVMAFRREMLLRMGGFDDALGAGKPWAGAEDLDIFVRIVRAGSTIVHDATCIVWHNNTREGQDYVNLHRGYGLGLGAMIAKWIHIDPVLGTRLAWRLVGRSVVRIVRAFARKKPAAHEHAMFDGIVTGARQAWRTPVIGERFASASPSASVSRAPSRAVDASTAPGASVELLRILDETHLASNIQYETMHTGCILVLSGRNLRLDDGSLDQEKILAGVDRLVRRVPEFRLRVIDSPLGMTAPAWVPASDFDLRNHVHFPEGTHDLGTDRLRWFIEGDRGLLPRDRPLWDFTFTLLTTGQVAFGARMHHANGDAKWAMERLTELTEASEVSEETPLPRTARPPASRALVPLYAARNWWRLQPNVSAAWREYWRKPVVKRVKRVVGRNIRPLKEVYATRRNLRASFIPPFTDTYFEVDASATARRAAKLRGSLNDLIVAAAMCAVDDDRDGIDVMVPVSRRKKGERAIRNHVEMLRAHGAPSSGLPEVIASVRSQVAAFARGLAVEEQPRGRSIGYVTLVPWSREPRFFSGDVVERFIVLPASDRRDELAVFAAVYGEKITLTVTTRAELDTDGIAGRLRSMLEGADE
ncbi:glycosyltransferase involved in cell wall biosynthesis [Microbacterium proteolyticum]|uniref:Glycosyltransferase involved in cell wall biosynthesis n=1 Tax=Microbacterium proteolyticum TaxID=1572644 RepID=A0A7W5CJS3_9MICO|nr:glycosyltransferase [Microbacterium proteolyticum]MBB3158947.1 glycosyltransferase involved in cell wall biosynthesis [Microbacterium proteolyticum]